MVLCIKLVINDGFKFDFGYVFIFEKVKKIFFIVFNNVIVFFCLICEFIKFM